MLTSFRPAQPKGSWLAGLALGVAFALAWTAPVGAQQFARCQSGELSAAGRLCRAQLGCWSKYAKRPEKDPDGSRRNACLAKARLSFERVYNRTVAAAFRKRQTCGYDAVVDDFLADSFTTPLDTLRDARVLTGWDPETATRDENTLYASVLQAAAALCGREFAAESSHLRRPDETKRQGAYDKATASFETFIARAVARAAKKGIPDPGFDVSGLAQDVESVVDDFLALTSPEFISLGGTIAAAPATLVDSDVNNPLTMDVFGTFVPNDTFADAQLIGSPSTIGGYAAQQGKGPVGPMFQLGDVWDVYLAPLTAAQNIVLYIGGDPTNTDLDLCLFDQFGNFLDCSIDVGSTEALVAPYSGIFYVGVYVYDRGSTYVLTVGQELPAGAIGGLRLSDEFVPGELIVRLSGDRAADEAQTAEVAAAAHGMKALGGAADREMLWGLGEGAALDEAFRVLGAETARRVALLNAQASSPEDVRKMETIVAAKALRRRANIAAADLNYLHRPMRVPNDDYYNLQWHYPLINLPQAWEVTTGHPDVVVAVIDTGVRLDHPDLQGQLVPGYDFISNKTSAGDGGGIDPDPDDPGDLMNGGTSSFHGTHVAGTVAAASNNGAGVAGVAWQARVMPVRVLGRLGGTSMDLIQAIRFSAGLSSDSGTVPNPPADVINMSLGGGGFSQAMQDTITAARNAGTIIIAAAGNSASSVSEYPASYDGVVSVAAVDPLKQRSSYSNFGPNVDVAAPGGEMSADRNGDGYADGVLSTLVDDSTNPAQFTYAFYQGTSMATPHVAGVAALMKAVNPTLDPDGFDAFLVTGMLTQDLGTAGRDDFFGHGLIDASKAVAAASGSPPPAFLVPNPGGLNFPDPTDSLTLTVENGGEGLLWVETITISYEPGDPTGWLTVAPDDVDGNGLGTYSVSVDRSGLASRTYAATITFDSSVNTLRVPVVMNKGFVLPADAGVQYVLLLDPVSFRALKEVGRWPSLPRRAHTLTSSRTSSAPRRTTFALEATSS
jgi:serine protease